jgi:hypothetical protein
MRRLLQLLSALALAGTIVPPLLFFGDLLTLDRMKVWMTVATLVWFAATPWWMLGADAEELKIENGKWKKGI